MTLDHKPIDSLFKSKLRNFEANHSTTLWDAIYQDLEADKPVPLYKKHYIVTIAASIALLLAFAAGYYLASNNQPEQQATANQQDSIYADERNNKLIETKIALKQLDDNTNKPKHTTSNATEKAIPYHHTTKPSENTLERNEIAENKNITPDKQAEKHKLNNTNSAATIAQVSLVSAKPIGEIISMERTGEKKPLPKKFTAQQKETKNNKTLPEVLTLSLNNPKDAYNPQWVVGGAFAPVYTYRNMKKNEVVPFANLFNNNNADSRYDYVEDAMMTYAGGVSVEYAAKKRWTIESGVYYMKMGQQTNEVFAMLAESQEQDSYTVKTSAGKVESKMEPLTKENEVFDSYGNIYDSNSDLIQNFDFLEVPLIVKYKMIDSKKVDVNLMGGIGTNILVGNRVFISDENGLHKIGETQNINPLNYRSTLGFGVEYTLTERFELNLEPQFKYSINSVNADVYYRPYSFAIFTGLNYKF